MKFQKLQTSEGFVPKDQCINLAEPEVLDNGNIEHYLESLLNYISIEGFGEQKPRFVTNKAFMGCLASKPIKRKVLIFRYMGIIFISFEKRERKSPEQYDTVYKTRKRASAVRGYTHGANYAYYLTRESDDEKIPEDYAKSGCKAVMKCDISTGYKEDLVFYSAEIDALNESNQHIELKAIVRGTEDAWFWKSSICTFYWKMLFGGCSTMLVGDRTGAKKTPDQKTYVEKKTGRVRDKETGEVIDQRTNTSDKDFPAYSLCKIEELKIGEIFEKMEKAKQKEKVERENLKPTNDIRFEEWSLEEGKERVRHFFRQVKRVCRYPAMCILAEEDQRRKGFWNFETVNEQNETIQEFVELVRTKMDIWKTNFF
ncbi:hypothetical protein B9Z55_003140 [Caenorhabditis nigoni]|nr:hypothetical protein B9Z55_003140 [Caenorhabditis nigoni]